MCKYVLFDVDGTLNQTSLYALEAYRTALKKRRLDADDTAIHPIIIWFKPGNYHNILPFGLRIKQFSGLQNWLSRLDRLMETTW